MKERGIQFEAVQVRLFRWSNWRYKIVNAV